MRPAGIVLAVTLAACGGARPPDTTKPDDRAGGAPFGAARDFKPKSFEVEVTGSGRPIIFIPGLGCPGDVWHATVEHLGDDYQAHVLTLAGFAGREPINEPLSAAVRRDLTRYIRSKRLVDPIIVGHSMGGFIAFWLASNLPEVVGPVVIVDAGPALSGDLEDAKQLRERWAGAEDAEFARQARFMYSGMARNKKKLEPIAALAAKSDRRALGDAIYEMMITDLTDRMKDIRSPVLVVLADGGLQQRFRAQVEDIEDKEIVVIPKTGHFVMIDDPDGFYGALEQFFEDHPAPKT
jgi:N-formylmaleamate deformylase